MSRRIFSYYFFFFIFFTLYSSSFPDATSTENINYATHILVEINLTMEI